MAQDFTVDRDSTKRVLGKNGVLVSYGTDEPAFEFNADGSYKGLLVEPAATNLCLQSEDLNTTWNTNENATSTQSTEETPDGDTSNKYIKLVDDSGGGTGQVRISQSITVSAGTKYTASVFFKKDGLNWARIQANDYDGGTTGYQYFDLDTGSLGSDSNLDDSSIEEYPNDWYRCSITWTQGAGDTQFGFYIFVADADNDISVDLDGTSSIFVWGAQVEAGPIATSYIPTTTASVTRAKDDISLASASSLIGQKATGGTLYIELDWRNSNGVAQYLITAYSTLQDYVSIYKRSTNALRMRIYSDNVEQTDQGVSSTAYDGVMKIALAYSNGESELYKDGSSISTDASVDLSNLEVLDKIVIGANYDIASIANMHIRAIAVFDKRLSDAECEALTTL